MRTYTDCLPGGCCPKCKEDVETDSKAMQCDLYMLHGRIHATCEGLSDEMYSIMVLGGQIKQFSILLHVTLIIV